MHTDFIERWRHPRVLLGAKHRRNERRTWLVTMLTAAMMVGEIVARLAFGFIALLAAGLHTITHAGALSIAALAYYYARRHSRDERVSVCRGGDA